MEGIEEGVKGWGCGGSGTWRALVFILVFYCVRISRACMRTSVKPGPSICPACARYCSTASASSPYGESAPASYLRFCFWFLVVWAQGGERMSFCRSSCGCGSFARRQRPFEP